MNKLLLATLTSLFFLAFLRCSAQPHSTFEKKNVGEEVSYENPSGMTLEKLTAEDLVAAASMGDYTLVYFFTTWCTPSKNGIELSLIPLIDSLGNQLNMLLIAATTKENEAMKILSKAGYPLQAYAIAGQKLTGGLFDKNAMKSLTKEVAKIHGQKVKVPFQSPLIYLLDKEGKIIEFDIGSSRQHIFEACLKHVNQTN